MTRAPARDRLVRLNAAELVLRDAMERLDREGYPELSTTLEEYVVVDLVLLRQELADQAGVEFLDLGTKKGETGGRGSG